MKTTNFVEELIRCEVIDTAELNAIEGGVWWL